MVLGTVAKLVVFTVTSLVNAQLEQPSAMNEGSILVCDDGLRPYTSTDRPRWKCEINGCTFRDYSCNHDENVCFDAHGNSLLEDDELCPHTTTWADGALESFGNFLWCDGSYYCLQRNSFGLCIKSVCLDELFVEPELES